LGTTENLEENKKLISFKEITPKKGKMDIMPNSVQHNVPAWALFAIFFIVVPLSINLVKEKSQGTSVRARISPTPYFSYFRKTFTYFIICVIQFLLMVAVGIYLFPYMDLPQFDVTGKMFQLIVVTFLQVWQPSDSVFYWELLPIHRNSLLRLVQLRLSFWQLSAESGFRYF
jgi:ABC-2 type transport system permease protein